MKPGADVNKASKLIRADAVLASQWHPAQSSGCVLLTCWSTFCCCCCCFCFLFLIIIYFEIGFLVKNHDYTVKMLPGTVHRKTKFLVNLYWDNKYSDSDSMLTAVFRSKRAVRQCEQQPSRDTG